MIPIVSQCIEDEIPGCPKLFDHLDSIREIVTASVLSVVEPTCGDDLYSIVAVPPFVLVPEENRVLVYPESVSLVRTKGKSALLVTTRTKVTAVVVVALSGYPTITETNEGYIATPHPSETHSASKFILGLSWCVWCALVDAINAENLLVDKQLHDDISVDSMSPIDFETGLGGFELRISWYA